MILSDSVEGNDFISRFPLKVEVKNAEVISLLEINVMINQYMVDYDINH